MQQQPTYIIVAVHDSLRAKHQVGIGDQSLHGRDNMHGQLGVLNWAASKHTQGQARDILDGEGGGRGGGSREEGREWGRY